MSFAACQPLTSSLRRQGFPESRLTIRHVRRENSESLQLRFIVAITRLSFCKIRVSLGSHFVKNTVILVVFLSRPSELPPPFHLRLSPNRSETAVSDFGWLAQVEVVESFLVSGIVHLSV